MASTMRMTTPKTSTKSTWRLTQMPLSKKDRKSTSSASRPSLIVLTDSVQRLRSMGSSRTRKKRSRTQTPALGRIAVDPRLMRTCKLRFAIWATVAGRITTSPQRFKRVSIALLRSSSGPTIIRRRMCGPLRAPFLKWLPATFCLNPARAATMTKTTTT